MKNAVKFKDCWLMPNSQAYEFFKEWKKQTDPKLQQVARKKFENHMHDVDVKYKQLTCG